ncbi:hypothetical protein [Dactylosporangium sp. NPDC051541]|uniref:hypothetical protein n=1 Tax=Dactylosporangium sp. NPDC051541 TaxID=3363977 RepID=UPI0037B9631A
MAGSELQTAARKRWAFAAFVVAEVLVIAYLIVGAFQADDEWRPWYVLAAAGLALILFGLIWSRYRTHLSGH